MNPGPTKQQMAAVIETLQTRLASLEGELARAGEAKALAVADARAECMMEYTDDEVVLALLREFRTAKAATEAVYRTKIAVLNAVIDSFKRDFEAAKAWAREHEKAHGQFKTLPPDFMLDDLVF